MLKMFSIVLISITILLAVYRIWETNHSEQELDKLNRAKELLGILVDISTVISVVLVLLTLVEMQIERDNTYRPDLVIEDTSFYIHLGKDDENSYILSETSEFDEHAIDLDLMNIGVGVAKNVSVEIDIDSYNRMGEYLESFADENAPVFSMNEVNYVYTNPEGKHHMTPQKEFELKKVYILPNAEETVKFSLPRDLIKMVIEYIVQIHNLNNEACILSGEKGEWRSPSIEIPNLKLNVEFQDVQGKHYKHNIYVVFDHGVILHDQNNDVKTKLEISMTTK